MGNTEFTSGDNLEILARILIRCFIGGILLLMIWFIGFTFFGDCIYELHSKWFLMPRQTFNAIHYADMAFIKILLIVLFLLPYIAIRLEAKKRD